jgi:hypothetical protein
MTTIRISCALPLLLLVSGPFALAAETTAEKALEAASFAASESETQASEEQAVIDKMDQDDAKSQGDSNSDEAPSAPGEATTE